MSITFSINSGYLVYKYDQIEDNKAKNYLLLCMIWICKKENIKGPCSCHTNAFSLDLFFLFLRAMGTKVVCKISMKKVYYLVLNVWVFVCIQQIFWIATGQFLILFLVSFSKWKLNSHYKK